MSQGEGEKAVKIMKRIARLNGREVFPPTSRHQQSYFCHATGASIRIQISDVPLFETKTRGRREVTE